MSYHWENIIWQSQDGSWSRGFYERIPTGSGWDEDYDSEWDDDFNFNSFAHLRRGFSSEDAAAEWRPGANPGGHSVMPYRGNSKECKALDQLAFFHEHPEEREKHERKELLRKNREHFKALQAEWTPELLRSTLADRWASLRVTVKSDDRAYEIYGMSSTYTGGLKQNGDWLEIEGKRVYNLKTDKFEKRVHKLERYTPSAGRPGYRLGSW